MDGVWKTEVINNIMKNKYLFLMITTGIGGAERLQMDYFRHTDYDKHSVIFAVSNDVFSAYFKKEGLPVKVVQLPQIKYAERFFKKFMTFYKFLKEIRPDCVVINQFWLKSFRLSEFAAAFMASGGNVYMFVHDYPPAHPEFKPKTHFGILPGLGLWWRKERLLQTLLVYFTKYTIAVSRATAEVLHKSHRFPEKKIKVVYHGVDVGKFSPSAESRAKFREDLNIPDSDKIIVSTARLETIKRIDRLIEAFGILARERKDIRLILVGTGSQYSELTKIANSLNKDIRQRVQFMGFQENVADILQAGDIYVLPSDSEGLPIACLEAMACGLITVVTDCGSSKEVINHGMSGFIVEKSREGVLEGLQKALGLPEEEKNKMSDSARRFVLENFDLEKNVKYGLGLLKINNS